jgi:hypothetical protein
MAVHTDLTPAEAAGRLALREPFGSYVILDWSETRSLGNDEES